MMMKKGVLEGIFNELPEFEGSGGIRAKDIPKIIGRSLSAGGGFNCYPGVPGNACQRLALFVALKGSPYAKGQGHLSCRQAFERIVQHVHGYCPDLEDMELIMITTQWNGKAFDEWRSVLNEISGFPGVNIRFFLWAGKTFSPINVL